MPALTPLLATPYPLATDTPAGNSQIEAVARAIEKATVVPVASNADRNAKFVAGILREGSVCFNTASRQFQVYTAGSWATVWTLGDRAYQSGTTRPAAASNPGLIFVDTNDDGVFFSDGASWIRLIDATDARLAKDVSDTGTATTDDQAGERNPNTGQPINLDVTVPDSGKLHIFVNALMSVTGSSVAGIFGFEVVIPGGATLVAYAAQKAARTYSPNPGSCGWQNIVDVGSNRAGQTVRVHGIHAVGDNAQTVTYTSRQITAVPVR